MKAKLIITTLGFVGGILLLTACSKNDNQATQPPPIQVKNNDLPEIKWDIKRIDISMKEAGVSAQAFFKNKPYKNPENQRAFLESKEWNDLYDKYFKSEIFALIPYCDPYFIDRPNELASIQPQEMDTFHRGVKELIGHFIAYPKMQDLADSVLKVYPPDYNFESHLKQPFQRFKKLYPAFHEPKVRTMIKAFNPRADWISQYLYDRLYVNKEYVGITLDYFSGIDFKITHPELPKYLRQRRRPEHLPPAVIGALIDFYRTPLTDKQTPTLTDIMIHEGIRYFAMDVLLPDTPDSLKFGASAQQIASANEYAPQIYKALLPHFFVQNYKKYEWAIHDGPATAFAKIGIQAPPQKELPSRLAIWMGWQMVRNYMNSHPEMTFEKLLHAQNYRQIFQESGYKPDLPN